MNLPPVPEHPRNRREPALELEEELETAWIVELQHWEEERLPRLLRRLSRYEGAKSETADAKGGSTSPSVNPLSRREPISPEAFPPQPFIVSENSPTEQPH